MILSPELTLFSLLSLTANGSEKIYVEEEDEAGAEESESTDNDEEGENREEGKGILPAHESKNALTIK